MQVTMLGGSYLGGIAYDPNTFNLGTVNTTGTSSATAPVQATATTPEVKTKATDIIGWLVDTTKDTVGIINDIKTGGTTDDKKALEVAMLALSQNNNNPTLAKQAVAKAPMATSTAVLISVGAVLVLGLVYMVAKKR